MLSYLCHILDPIFSSIWSFGLFLLFVSFSFPLILSLFIFLLPLSLFRDGGRGDPGAWVLFYISRCLCEFFGGERIVSLG